MPFYPQLSDPTNLPLIGITAVIGLFLVIIVYYIVVSKSSRDYKKLYNMPMPDTNQRSLRDMDVMGAGSEYGSRSVPTGASYAPVPSQTKSNVKQVFNIKQNMFALDDAPAVCGAFGAEVATIEQLIDAHKQGADWCNVGWTKDGLAAYPTQLSTWKLMQEDSPDKRGACGVPGINLARNDPNLLYGVNCYGPKPNPRGSEKVKRAYISDKQNAINAKIIDLQKNLDNINIVGFNQDNWSQ